MTVIEEARDLLKGRLTDLSDEQKKVERALAALDGGGKKPGRPKGPRGTGTTGRKRRKRSGTREAQALKMIEEQPGISASDIAKAMKIKPNYLYRVLGSLEKEGRVKKDGRKYSPAS
jgi:hypothetical protein